MAFVMTEAAKNWLRTALSMIKLGGYLAYPRSGLIYQITKENPQTGDVCEIQLVEMIEPVEVELRSEVAYFRPIDREGTIEVGKVLGVNVIDSLGGNDTSVKTLPYQQFTAIMIKHQSAYGAGKNK